MVMLTTELLRLPACKNAAGPRLVHLQQEEGYYPLLACFRNRDIFLTSFLRTTEVHPTKRPQSTQTNNYDLSANTTWD